MKNAHYREAEKAIKKSAKNNHRTLIENKAKFTEEAAKRGDSRVLYKITSEIFGKKRTVNGPVWDSSSVLVTEPAAVNELWVSHFEILLNGPPPE